MASDKNTPPMKKETIEGIEVNEVVVQQKLEWLAYKKNHVLDTDDLSELVRYLLKRVNELETRLNHFNSQTRHP